MAIEAIPVVRDFAVIMIIASVMALISYRFKQPMVMGYIAAGMIIGPHTPPFSLVLNTDVLELLAEIGVILLLFVVGLEFPIEKLRKIGKKAIVIYYGVYALTSGILYILWPSGLLLKDKLMHTLLKGKKK